MGQHIEYQARKPASELAKRILNRDCSCRLRDCAIRGDMTDCYLVTDGCASYMSQEYWNRMRKSP